MSFPLIQIKSTNINLSSAQRALIEHKLTALAKLLPPEKTDLHCEFEAERLPEHQSGRIFRAEVNLSVGGTLYRAEATEEQLEKSIDVVRNELKQVLQSELGKRHTLKRKGGQLIKEMMQESI